MAKETILVVDADPFDLLVVAARLRGSGFTVQIVSSAEQALTMLRTLRPELMVAATRLPGIDGFELARKVRKDAQLRGMVLVALLPPGAAGDDSKAIEAGYHGYLIKPVDVVELVRRVKEYLASRARQLEEGGEAGVPVPPELLTDPEMEGLRRNFLADGSRNCRALVDTLDTQFDSEKAGQLAGQWAASAAHLGFPAIAAASRELHTLLSAGSFGKLREVMLRLQESFGGHSETAVAPVPSGILGELAGKRLALVGFAEREAERICSAIELAQAEVCQFDGNEPTDSASVRVCDAVLVHVRTETAGSGWLRGDLETDGLPMLVLVGARDSLLALEPAVQARAQEFLIDGWQPEEVILRLSLALSRKRSAPPASKGAAVVAPPSASPVRKSLTVLIADDDVDIRMLVSAILGNHGIKVHTATHGAEAMEMMTKDPPDAVVLDVNMPGMDGFEVLAKMREAGSTIPAILLTARQQENDILRAFSLGAKDYVVKPFSPLELLARLRRLIV